MKTIGAILAALALSSCAFNPQERFINTAYDYNLTLEHTQNQMLLVNIVRGSQRRPMYFSAVSAMRGALTTEVTAGVELEFLTQSARASKSTPGVKFAANPTFDFVPLDSKNFTRGILTPAPLESLVYYWNQGWPRDLLLHMFIQAIESNGVRYENYPPREAELRDFQIVMRNLLCKGTSDHHNCSLTLISEDDVSDTPIAATTATLKEATLLEQASLRLVKRDGVYKIAAKKKSSRVVGELDKECVPEKQRELDQENPPGADKDKMDANKAKAEKFCTPKIFFRSPEAMLYYLGEILRVHVLEGKQRPMLNICSDLVPNPGAPLFLARKDFAGGAVVSIPYDGHTYSIPRDDPTDSTGCTHPRSMHALTLVGQLIGQNKDVADLPTTGAVTVVGPK